MSQNQPDTFKQARDCITESLILSYCDTAKSKIYKRQGGIRELSTLCPFRGDTRVGSFFINLDNGMWIDKSTSAEEPEGDLIKLVSLTFKLSLLDAAKRIIHDSGGVLPESKPKSSEKEKSKYEAIIPIPEDKLSSLNDHIKKSFIVEKFGEPTKGWKYNLPDGGAWMCVTRHIKPNQDKPDKPDKNDILYHYCSDKKWHAGAIVQKNRHLFNIEKLKHDSKVLITEGNKCADIEIEGRLSMTWYGGGNQIKKYNWKVLKEIEDIIFWPDYDIKKDKEERIFPDERQPGLKTALEIQKKLPHNKILNVYPWCRKNNKPDGWDIFDANEEGIDLQKFIEEVGFYEQNTVQTPDTVTDYGDTIQHHEDNIEVTPPPFLFMGHDEGRHYFLVNRSNIIKSISFGSFSNGKLLELASLSYWSFNFPGKKSAFDLHEASDWIIDESEKKGFFMKENVRGSGVWMDNENIIINSGNSLYDEKGSKISKIDTEFFYIHSNKRMGTFSGPVSTSAQGLDLMNLFLAQGFETQLEAFIALGWTLIAPFAGILKWRPHIWITGPKSCGKSYFLENFIQELLGPFCHVGSGKDSAPGIYRSIKSDPVPILLDEMEPGKKANKDTIRKIEDKLELARNASSDFSGHITLANSNTGGSDSFFIRSPFCFSSIVPYMHGEAIESRILTCRMKHMDLVVNKMDNTREFLKTGLMDDPGIFRRRIFSKLRYIIEYIEMLRKILIKETGEVRKADNLAPLFAATFYLGKDDSSNKDIPDKAKATEFVREMVAQFELTETETDEDKLLRALFDFTIKLNPSDTLSIAEMLNILGNYDETFTEDSDDFLTKNDRKEYDRALKQHGIKIHETGGVKFLAIATAHKQLQDILAETMYSGQYVQVLKRHTAYEKDMSVSFAGQNKGAVLLKWNVINKKYFQEEKIEKDDFPF